MFHKSMVSLLVVVAGATSGWGQVRLERKMQEGARYTTKVSATIDQTLTIAGMETETQVETESVSKSTVGRRAADGTLRVEEKVEAMQVTIGGSAGDYSFDSNDPDNSGSSPIEIVRPVHKLLAKRTMTVVFDKDNLVESVETDQNILASLPVQVQALVEDQLDSDTLKQALNQALRSLPDDPVREGDTWERSESANFGAGQVMTFDVTYTYAGTVEQDGKQLDKITLKLDSVDFTLEDNPALPLSLKDSDLKIAESQGFTLFDRQAGQIVKTAQKARIKGDLTFEANGQELPSQLDLTIEAETSVKAN